MDHRRFVTFLVFFFAFTYLYNAIIVPKFFPKPEPPVPAQAEDQPEDPTGGEGNPMMKIMGSLMESGGLVLHGEQEFRYHQSVQCGDVLHWEGKITDIYTKESKGKTMTFIVMETVFRNQVSEPVVTEIFNLIHRGA